MGLGAELTMQLHLPVCAVVGASDGTDLTLQWLMHTIVQCEVIPGEVCWGHPSQMAALRPPIRVSQMVDLDLSTWAITTTSQDVH